MFEIRLYILLCSFELNCQAPYARSIFYVVFVSTILLMPHTQRQKQSVCVYILCAEIVTAFATPRNERDRTSVDNAITDGLGLPPSSSRPSWVRTQILVELLQFLQVLLKRRACTTTIGTMLRHHPQKPHIRFAYEGCHILIRQFRQTRKELQVHRSTVSQLYHLRVVTSTTIRILDRRPRRPHGRPPRRGSCRNDPGRLCG